MMEQSRVSARESAIHETLLDIKHQADQKVLDNARMLSNESYFLNFMSPIVISSFGDHGIHLDAQSAEYINDYTTKEYLYEFTHNTW